VPDYIQQLWNGQVALQNQLTALNEGMAAVMATQEQIDQLTEKVQGLQASLTHSQSEIRTELDRLSGQGVDTSGLEGALDNLAQEVRATEDIIPDVDTTTGGGETPPSPEQPGNPPPESPPDITAPALGTEPPVPDAQPPSQPPAEQPPDPSGLEPAVDPAPADESPAGQPPQPTAGEPGAPASPAEGDPTAGGGESAAGPTPPS
jgi:hypothetical protein